MNDCPLCKATRPTCPYGPVVATNVKTGKKVRLSSALVQKITKLLPNKEATA